MKSRILVIFSVLSCLVAVLAATSAKADDSTVTVSVPAIQPWNDTGVFINAGDSVSITATGIIKIAGSDPGKTPAGAPGCITEDDTWLADGLTCWSLIGRIGDNPAFEVGDGTSFTATSSGELFLSVDDNYFPDNSGAWTATITFGPPPCPQGTKANFRWHYSADGSAGGW